jgi:Ca2+/Na+ antiporter
VRLFFGGRLRKTISLIRSNEFLVFAFFFALILAFFAGFTSILFGVLVRFKAPVLPFLVLLLSLRREEEKREPREEK